MRDKGREREEMGESGRGRESERKIGGWREREMGSESRKGSGRMRERHGE